MKGSGISAEKGGRALKICFVIAFRSCGGAERASGELAGILAELGCDVHFVVRTETALDYPIDPRVTVRKVDPGLDARFGNLGLRAFAASILAAREILRVGPDVVVPFLPWAEFAAFSASLISGAATVATVRNDPAIYPRSRLLRFCKDRFCGRADLIYVQNEEQAGYFPKSWRERIFVLPNLIGREFFRIVPHDGPIRRFIAAGRLEAQKNHEMMVRAFAMAAAMLPDADLHLDIFGEGRLQNSLESLIRELSMEGRIVLRGFSQNIAAEYASADAFLLSSDFEGQPNALMEAMAAGLPCISTSFPMGPSGLIREGMDGILVPCGDVSAMAEAIAALAADPDNSREMGRSAKERVNGMCSRERVGAEFIERCRQAVESRRRRSSARRAR